MLFWVHFKKPDSMAPNEIATKQDIDSLRRMIEQFFKQGQAVKMTYSRKEACTVLGISEAKFLKLEELGIIQGGDYLPNGEIGKLLYKASSINRLVDNLPD